MRRRGRGRRRRPSRTPNHNPTVRLRRLPDDQEARRLALLIALAVTTTSGHVPFLGGMPVFDATNFGNAIKRHLEMFKQFEQLVLTYEQIILEYEIFRGRRSHSPACRAKLSFTPWRFSRSAIIYGTSGAWTLAINSGARIVPGYRRVAEQFLTYAPPAGTSPANQVDRLVAPRRKANGRRDSARRPRHQCR